MEVEYMTRKQYCNKEALKICAQKNTHLVVLLHVLTRLEIHEWEIYWLDHCLTQRCTQLEIWAAADGTSKYTFLLEICWNL